MFSQDELNAIVAVGHKLDELGYRDITGNMDVASITMPPGTETVELTVPASMWPRLQRMLVGDAPEESAQNEVSLPPSALLHSTVSDGITREIYRIRDRFYSTMIYSNKSTRGATGPLTEEEVITALLRENVPHDEIERLTRS